MIHEERLKRYFEQESVRGDLSAQQWESVLSHVKLQEQRRGIRRFMTLFTPRRPLLASAVTLVLLVMAGGASLWVTAEARRGRLKVGELPYLDRAGPPPQIVEDVWEVDKGLITPGEPITINLTLKNIWDEPIEFTDFPITVPLKQVGTGAEEPIPLALKDSGAFLGPVEPGEEVTTVAHVTSETSAGLQPGGTAFESA